MPSQIQFCKSADGTRLAFMTQGSGPPLVLVASMGTCMEQPTVSEFHQELANHAAVLIFDRRGSGLSERDPARLGLEAELEDLQALVDHVGLEEFALFGTSDGTAPTVAFAANHPDRVSHLILWGGMASGSKIARPGAVEGFTALVRSNWRMARRAVADMVFPSGPPERKQSMVDGIKESLTPETAARMFELYWQNDVTEYLPQVRCPALVLHRRGDALVPTSAARELASLLPDARLSLLDGDQAASVYNFEQYLDIVWEFLGEETDEAQPEQAGPATAPSTMRTVLFTDLVGHTEMMSRLGDERGREVLREHERITREVLATHGGKEVKTMGDGFMASFGSVTKAVECAIALQTAMEAANRDAESPLALGAGEGKGVRVRVGLNAGEPIEEDGDLFGATVILASRIAAKADGGEILVADTVRGLCSGKGFAFSDRGEFVAKGFDEPVRVYEVSWLEGR